MTTINDKVLKAIFGSTLEEAAAELAALQSKDAAWLAARGLAASAALTAPTGSIIVPVLGYADEPGALLVEVVNTHCGIAAVGVYEYTVAGNVWPRPMTSNFTPFEGSWSDWRKTRLLGLDLEAKAEIAKAKAAQAADDSIALEKSVAEMATKEVRQRHIGWFLDAFKKSVYQLWNEDFLTVDERDMWVGVFCAKGKLFDEAEAIFVMRNKIMALCPTPVDVKYISVTQTDVEAVADVLAAWVNGDLDITPPVQRRLK